MARKFTADFETSTENDKAWVWAYGICEISNINNFIYGNNIDDFMEWLADDYENYVVYFHNLKFDGEYIFSWLLNNDFTWIKDNKDAKTKTFTCLISDMGQFYSIEIYFKKKGKKVNKATIYDSLKILNFSVEQIAKDFDLPIRKGELDYELVRYPHHKINDEELSYLKNDVEIMARALEMMFIRDLTKMTIGSNALSNFKSRFKYEDFMRFFPTPAYEVWQDLRQAYKGGFTYLNDIYQDKDVKNEIVLDVNSMYPSILRNEKLPYGEGMFFEGKYEYDKNMPLYIQMVTCSFELKKNKIPTIQIKGTLSFLPNEYLKTSNGDIVSLALTNYDLELFLENYNVEDLCYVNGWKYKAMSGLFTSYIDYWYNEKTEAGKNKNKSQKTIAKLMLNSLYGKMGLSYDVRGKYPYLENEVVKYRLTDLEQREGIYIPVAIFTTSIGRYKIINASQKIRDYSIQKYKNDMYIYSDTDSIHTLLPEEECKNIIDINDYKLGAFKVEERVKKARYLRQKCYVQELEDGTLNTTIAGLPKKLGYKVNFDNFRYNFTTSGKLTFKHVKGGVILVDTTFSIK